MQLINIKALLVIPFFSSCIKQYLMYQIELGARTKYLEDTVGIQILNFTAALKKKKIISIEYKDRRPLSCLCTSIQKAWIVKDTKKNESENCPHTV